MIKAIFFDFGNVLYDLDFELFYDNFSALLDTDVRQGFPEQLVKAMADYEIGEINTETFIWNFQHYMKGSIDPLDIINCWNSLLRDFPSERWKFLEAVHSRFQTFLLSNINELHLSTVYKHIRRVHGRVDFETTHFNGVFYSHLIGRSKPNPTIYQFVLDSLGFKGEEVLFIDDREENVLAARNEGWNAELHDPKTKIEDQFDQYLSKYLVA